MGKGFEWTFLHRRCTNGQEAHEKMFIIDHEENRTEIHNEIPYHFTPTSVAVIKRWATTSVEEDVEKLKSSCIASGNVKRRKRFGKRHVSSSKLHTAWT